MPCAQGGRFINAAEEMTGTVRQRQAPEHAAGQRVFERAAVALPVIEADKAVATGGNGGGLGIEDFVDVLGTAFGLGGFVAGEMLAIPVHDGAGRRLAAFER